MHTTNSTPILKVLSVSPFQDDHRTLQTIIGRSTWMLFSADRLAAAADILQQQGISVVLCERDITPGTWVDLVEEIKDLLHPPSMVVTSRLADEQLWVEALNLGAWDVLAKPFQPTEVLRSVKAAWQHWYNQVHTAPLHLVRAAS
jgi:DNA-binding response OmpR family regulator